MKCAPASSAINVVVEVNSTRAAADDDDDASGSLKLAGAKVKRYDTVHGCCCLVTIIPIPLVFVYVGHHSLASGPWCYPFAMLHTRMFVVMIRLEVRTVIKCGKGGTIFVCLYACALPTQWVIVISSQVRSTMLGTRK